MFNRNLEMIYDRKIKVIPEGKIKMRRVNPIVFTYYTSQVFAGFGILECVACILLCTVLRIWNRIYVFEVGDDVVGTVMVSPKGYISNFGITQYERGKGYAKPALQLTLTKIKSPTATLSVNKKNLTAIELYKKAGFRFKQK